MLVRRISRIVPVMLILAVVLTAGACSRRNDNDIIKAASKYAEALSGGDMQYIRRGSLDATAEEIDNIKSRLDVNDNRGKVIKTIQEGITFEVDEDSVTSDGSEASVKVVFSIPDWESLAKDKEAFKDAESYANAIGKTDKKIEVDIELEFEQDENEAWKVANYVEAARKFCDAWTDVKVPVSAADMVEQVNWKYASSTSGIVKYHNTDKIECDILMAPEFGDRPVYYEVSHDGKTVFKSELSPDSLKGIYKSDSGNLADGDYSFFFYDEDGNLIVTATCTVASRSDPGTVTVTSSDNASSRAEIMDKDRVDYICWWWYDKEDDGVTYVNTVMLCMEVKLKSGFESTECYFEVEYNGTKVFTSKPSFVQTFYLLSLDEGVPVDPENHLAKGEYKVTMFDMDGNAMASDICKVEGGDIDGREEAVTPSDVVSTYWFGSGSSDKTYTDADKIELDLLLDTDSAGASVYYEVSYGGKVVYKSMTSGKSFQGVFTSAYDGATADGNGKLAKGEYTISFYAFDGSFIIADTCTVK